MSEEEGARRTEGRKEGRADAGGMAANKTRTPHRDVGKKHSDTGDASVRVSSVDSPSPAISHSMCCVGLCGKSFFTGRFQECWAYWHSQILPVCSTLFELFLETLTCCFYFASLLGGLTSVFSPTYMSVSYGKHKGWMKNA